MYYFLHEFNNDMIRSRISMLKHTEGIIWNLKDSLKDNSVELSPLTVQNTLILDGNAGRHSSYSSGKIKVKGRDDAANFGRSSTPAYR